MEYNILLMFLPLNQRIFFSEIYENLDLFIYLLIMKRNFVAIPSLNSDHD